MLTLMEPPLGTVAPRRGAVRTAIQARVMVHTRTGFMAAPPGVIATI